MLKKNNLDKYLADLMEIKQELIDEIQDGYTLCNGECNHA